MKLSIISDQVSQDFLEACKTISDLGLDTVEIHNVFNKSIEQCNFNEVKQIKEILKKYNLKVSNIASTVFFMAKLYEDYEISLFNENFHVVNGTIEDHLIALENACKIANELDCKSVRIFPFRFPDNKVNTKFGTDKDLNEIFKHLKKAISIAEKYDICLGLENCPYSHCPKGEMTLKLVQLCNSNYLKCLWDPANSYRAIKSQVPDNYKNITLHQEYKLLKDNISHVHIKNYTFDETKVKPYVHVGILEGDINFAQLLPLLSKEKLHPYLSLEPEVDYDTTIKCIKDAITLSKIL